MREWFSNQSPRDQIALLLLAGFLVVFGLFQFALVPASEARGQMALNNQAASAQLSRVETKVSRLLSLRETGSSNQSQNLSSTLSAAAQNAGLTVKRLQPNSRGAQGGCCLLYTSPSPRDGLLSRMPSSA